MELSIFLILNPVIQIYLQYIKISDYPNHNFFQSYKFHCFIVVLISLTFFDKQTVSIPSILILPSIFESLKRAEINDDFPAPVLPTMPT